MTRTVILTFSKCSPRTTLRTLFREWPVRLAICGSSGPDEHHQFFEEIRPKGFTDSIVTLYAQAGRRAAGQTDSLLRDLARPVGLADWEDRGRFPASDGELVPVYAFL